MEVSKRPQRVAAACTWLMLGLAVVGVLISGHDAIGSVTINPAALLAGLGVARRGRRDHHSRLDLLSSTTRCCTATDWSSISADWSTSAA